MRCWESGAAAGPCFYAFVCWAWAWAWAQQGTHSFRIFELLRVMMSKPADMRVLAATMQ